jgi:translation initiation factor 5B
MSEFKQNMQSNFDSNNENKKKKNNKKKSNDKPKQPSVMAKLILERRKQQENEDLRIKAIEEEAIKKQKEEEQQFEELKRKEEEIKEQKRKIKHDKILAQKESGTYKTKSEKLKLQKNQERIEQMKKLGFLSNDGKIVIIQNNNNKINITQNNDKDLNKCVNEKVNFRCPIFTIVGHVDTGKTTLLDNLRNTFVQLNEVGGITQQIGATLLTHDIIFNKIQNISNCTDILIPGLLLIDTPGHEVFKNLRVIGTQLADIVIIIVDIVHGLEKQTIESIKLLNDNNIPFMFVFNKIDRLYAWDKNLNSCSISEIISKQDINTKSEFDTRLEQIKTQIMMLGINCELEWNNISIEDTINIIPISAVTGQGIPDLLNCIIKYSQTILKSQIEWKQQLECIIMEITNIEGHGYILDCIIKNGQLKKGDIIKIQTQSSFIITKIKNILTVPENKDSKSICKYLNHDEINSTCQIKIVANNLEKSLIGSFISLSIKEDLDNYENCQVKSNNSFNLINTDNKGIAVYTSTHGSLESLIEFLKSDKELHIPIQISQANIGNVSKKDIVKLFLSNQDNYSKKIFDEYMCILLFEANIDDDAIQYAKDNKITILKDDTIYRLFTQYKMFSSKIYNERKEYAKINTIFPCVLKIIESNIFNKKNPLIMGIDVQDGTLHIGTPLIILPSKISIGKVVGIQINNKDVNIAKQGQSVCIKIESDSNITYGRQFTHKDLLYSNLTRKSVDLLKEYFKNDLSKDDIVLLAKLKKLINF